MKIYASVYSPRLGVGSNHKHLSRCESLADAQIKAAQFSKHTECSCLECYEVMPDEVGNHESAGFYWLCSDIQVTDDPVFLIHTNYKKGFHPIGKEPVNAPWIKGRENCYGFGVIINQGNPHREKKCVVIFDSGEKTETARGAAKKFEMLAMAIRNDSGVPFEVPFIGNELNAGDYPSTK